MQIVHPGTENNTVSFLGKPNKKKWGRNFNSGVSFGKPAVTTHLVSRFATSLTGIEEAMVKESSSENLASIPTIWIFQVKYIVSGLRFFVATILKLELDKSLSKNARRTYCQQITSTICFQVLPNWRSFVSRSHWLSCLRVLSTFDLQFQAIFTSLLCQWIAGNDINPGSMGLR